MAFIKDKPVKGIDWSNPRIPDHVFEKELASIIDTNNKIEQKLKWLEYIIRAIQMEAAKNGSANCTT